MRGYETVKELALAAVAVGSSYAIFHAFQEALKLPFASGSTIRWFTDSRSCIDAIDGQPRRYGEMILKLWGLMEQLMSVEGIWIPSHCRIPRGDAGEE